MRDRETSRMSGSPHLRAPASVSYRMSAVRQSDTKPELALRTLVHALGMRYRVCCRELPGRPDLSNRSRRWCIFVHGCFWHGHRCKRGRLPKVNLHFWKPKIKQNKRRDEVVRKELRGLGYRVLTVWQCQLKQTDKVTARLAKFLNQMGE
jgi:DNA mismatch endonuclease (patch repair protein)